MHRALYACSCHICELLCYKLHAQSAAHPGMHARCPDMVCCCVHASQQALKNYSKLAQASLQARMTANVVASELNRWQTQCEPSCARNNARTHPRKTGPTQATECGAVHACHAHHNATPAAARTALVAIKGVELVAQARHLLGRHVARDELQRLPLEAIQVLKALEALLDLILKRLVVRNAVLRHPGVLHAQYWVSTSGGAACW